MLATAAEGKMRDVNGLKKERATRQGGGGEEARVRGGGTEVGA